MTRNEILIELTKFYSRDYELAVSLDYRAPTEALEILSVSDSDEVRENVARNMHTPRDILITLSNDKSPHVRAGVAVNPNTPIDTLIELSKDEHPRVRKGVTENNLKQHLENGNKNEQ